MQDPYLPHRVAWRCRDGVERVSERLDLQVELMAGAVCCPHCEARFGSRSAPDAAAGDCCNCRWLHPSRT